MSFSSSGSTRKGAIATFVSEKSAATSKAHRQTAPHLAVQIERIDRIDGTSIEVVGKHIDQIIVDIQRRIISNRIDFNLGKKFPRQLAHRIAQRFASLVVLAEKLLEFRLEKAPRYRPESTP